MRTIVTFLILIFCFNLFCQIPSGGKECLTQPAINNYAFSGSCTVKLDTVIGQSFSQAVDFATSSPVSANAWDKNFSFSVSSGFQQKDCLLFTFYARVLSGNGTMLADIEQNVDPWTKSMYHLFMIDDQWRQYFFTFTAADTLPANIINVEFDQGAYIQEIEMADIHLIDYGQTLSINEMPVSTVTYDGRDPNASWRVPANQRIDSIRKGKIQITVVDTSGKPVHGAQVSIKQTNHLFPFGTCIAADDFINIKQYRDSALTLFNHFVIENHLKWLMWQYTDIRHYAFQAIDTCLAHGKPVRGHNMIWPSFANSPGYLQSLLDNILSDSINNHIQEMASTFTGKLVDWDVINEPYTNVDFMNLLGYPDMASWYKLAKQYDPVAKLFLNDFGVIEDGGLDTAHQKAYIHNVKYIDSLGGPLEGVGLEAHFGDLMTTPDQLILTSPDKMESILDTFALLNKEIKITEFDINIGDSICQADYTRDFLTLAFSHPAVKGILIWGFWETDDWLPQAALYRSDWSIKPNGQVWKQLLYHTWWTDTVINTDNNGLLQDRVFLGNYNYSVLYNYNTYTGNFTITSNDTTKEITIQLAKIPLSIVNSSQNKIQISPDPVGNTLNILDHESGILSIYNINGALQIQQQITNAQIQIDVSSLASGLYIIKISNENSLKTGKFIKE